MPEGKEQFYKKAEEALTSRGYQYYDGDRDIPGKGRHHASKPDYIAIKNNIVVIGEIKSPKEGPKSGSWRQVQPNDSEEFKAVRHDVARREEMGELSKQIGGHEIIILGQIPDYVNKLGKTYDLPVVAHGRQLVGGYTLPTNEASNAQQALKACRKAIIDRIDKANGSMTLIFEL